MSDQSVPSSDDLSRNVEDLLRDVEKLQGNKAEASYTQSHRVSDDEDEVVHIEIKIQGNEAAAAPSLNSLIGSVRLGKDIVLPIVGFIAATAGFCFVTNYAAKSGELLGSKMFK
jgi:hypothetical protein